MRHALRLTPIVALALGGAPALPAQDVPELRSEVSSLSLSHDAVTCMVANQHPRIDASLVPEPSVQAARVYFRSALGPDFYYVEMQPEAGRFVGTLPRPNPEAGPVTYYVEGLALDYTQTQTLETAARVVENEGDCDGKLAAVVPGDTPVRVFSTTGATTLPPGFTGVSTVLLSTGAGTAATAAGATTAAAAGATGGFLTSTAGFVVLGAGLLGIATVVVVTTGGEDPPPASGSR